jgi:peptide/nickel transport system permease protein
VVKHLALPAIALATHPMSIIARMTRSSMLEVLQQDYVRTAHAKGLRERVVLFRHALKNAFLPIITIIGLQTGTLLAGAILTETIFAWPGIGKWVYDAILGRDYPIVQGGTLLIALIFVFINLLVDVSYAFLDPRIHYE